MSIEEAISILKQYIDYDNSDVPDFYTMEEACKVVIEALEQQPTDAVDRVTIKEYLESFEVAQPKMGRWIQEKSIYGWDGKSYQCSECGRSIHLDTAVEDITDYPYCHCGAKMQEAEEY